MKYDFESDGGWYRIKWDEDILDPSDICMTLEFCENELDKISNKKNILERQNAELIQTNNELYTTLKQAEAYIRQLETIINQKNSQEANTND